MDNNTNPIDNPQYYTLIDELLRGSRTAAGLDILDKATLVDLLMVATHVMREHGIEG